MGGESIFHLSSTETRDMSTLVVRAYARALSVAPDLPDLFVGGNLGTQYESICHAARESGVEQRLHLLGRISDEELRQRYASATLCVQPSQNEGFGVQPLEVLACGARLIIFPEPAVQEVVGDVAVVTRDDSEHFLAEAIAQLWNDKDQRSTLRENGRKRATRFSWERTSTLLADLLVSMTQNKAVSPGNASTMQPSRRTA